MDYREIARLKSDPTAVAALASGLLGHAGDVLTDADRSFLHDLASGAGRAELTTRQGEYLLDLRDRTTRLGVVARYRVSDLVRQIWQARLDLDEEQQDWVEELTARGSDLSVTERQWRRLCALARRLGLIDDEFIPFRA